MFKPCVIRVLVLIVKIILEFYSKKLGSINNPTLIEKLPIKIVENNHPFSREASDVVNGSKEDYYLLQQNLSNRNCIILRIDKFVTLLGPPSQGGRYYCNTIFLTVTVFPCASIK